MFGWLQGLVPKKHKEDPVVTEAKSALVEVRMHIAESETKLSKKVGGLRKHHEDLLKAMDEVVILVQGRRK